MLSPRLAKATTLCFPSAWNWYRAAPSPQVDASVCRINGSLKFANASTGACVT